MTENHRLTNENRIIIWTLKKEGKSGTHIAARIGCSVSTISRELDRNKGKKGYRRFAGLTENGYTTNQSQESTCLTMLRNECCVGYWKAGGERVGCCYKLRDYGVRVI